MLFMENWLKDMRLYHIGVVRSQTRDNPWKNVPCEEVFACLKIEKKDAVQHLHMLKRHRRVSLPFPYPLACFSPDSSPTCRFAINSTRLMRDCPSRLFMTEWTSRFSLLLLRQRLTTNGSRHTNISFTIYSLKSTVFNLWCSLQESNKQGL